MSTRSAGCPGPKAAAVLPAVTILLLLALAIAAPGCGGGDEEEAEEVPRTALVPGALDDTLHATTDTTAWHSMAGTGEDDAVLPTGDSTTGDSGEAAHDAPEPEVLESVATRDEPAADQASPAETGAFSLQLGSFQDLGNARRQAELLRKNGYDPVLETSTLGGQTYHRVVLRGLPDRSAASALGERIHAELGITYLVRQNR